MPSTSSSRKSRWGTKSSQVAKEPTAVGVQTASSHVTDQDAVGALLAEAQATEKERQRRPPSSSRPSKRPRGEEKQQDAEESMSREQESSSEKPKAKANFGLSGALLQKDENHSVLYKGVILKFQEPPEARAPNTPWRFYVFKQDELLETLHISRQSAYLVGRNAEICDIHVAHPSCSVQHAVLQYRALPQDNGKLLCKPYLMDLESTNGTSLNGVTIEPARYYELKKGDVVKFGASTREYVLLTADTTTLSSS